MGHRESALETLNMTTQQLHTAYHGKRVFLTGHTGFKGKWLHAWLEHIGAHVTGYSLPNDICDPDTLERAMLKCDPDFVFHLAAQTIVGVGYSDPYLTYETNVNGTINVLNALRFIHHPCAAVIVTTDKVYENNGIGRPFSEADPLGGYDPYSSSKASAELAVSSWRRSFFTRRPGEIRIATARAGNVIGGGDTGTGRIVPDCLKAITQDKPLFLRMPLAIRPWQHVLDVLHGYLILGSKLMDGSTQQEPYNFGPPEENCISVFELCRMLAEHAKKTPAINFEKNQSFHEEPVIRLNSNRAIGSLGWRTKLTLSQSVKLTVDFSYGASHGNMPKQIAHYESI